MKVYQTLENRKGDPRELEKKGPYSCRWSNTWLGDGYYFWDTLIDNAHWWGKDVRKYENGYIICQAICDFNDNECFDLHGNMEHLSSFRQAYELMKRKTTNNKPITVKKVLTFLRRELKTFPYTAVRANGLLSRKKGSKYDISLLFEENKPQYLEMTPAVQICFYEKTSLNLRGYQIVYPPEYDINYCA